MIKMLRKLFVILLLAALFAPLGCGKDEVVDLTRYRTVVIRVPADTYFGQRTPGDPGEASTLQIPSNLYFFTIYTPRNVQAATPLVSAFLIAQISSDSWTPVSDATGKDAISGNRSLLLNTMGQSGWPRSIRLFKNGLPNNYLYKVSFKYKVLEVSKSSGNIGL